MYHEGPASKLTRKLFYLTLTSRRVLRSAKKNFFAKMKCFSVHRKYFKISTSSLASTGSVICLALLLASSVVADPQFHPSSFIDSPDDLLALPSDPQVERSGPITQYAFDNVPLESKMSTGAVAVALPPPPQPPPRPSNPMLRRLRRLRAGPAPPPPPVPLPQPGTLEQPYAAGSAVMPIDQQGPRKSFVHGPSAHLHPQPIDPVAPQYSDGAVHADGQQVVASAAAPVPVAAPVVSVGPPTTVFVPDEHHAVAVAESGYSHLGFLDIYHDILAHPQKALQYILHLGQHFTVPQDHYMNVISFVGIYLFMSYLFYSTEDVLQLTCEITGGNKKSIHKEWAYHAGRRFVAAAPVDPKMQKKFLQLFKGGHLDGDGGSSSEEDFSGEISQISDLCPKDAFFYSLSPMHIEAWTQLQRLFVAQRTPADVLALAKDLLYSHKIHPKIWYLGLMAAAQERPDMTGFTLAHPLDAIPDWFIPAHLIKDEFDRYRSLTLEKQGDPARANRIKRSPKSGNSTMLTTSRTTTSIPDSAEMSGEFVGLDGKLIIGNQRSHTSGRKGDDRDPDEKKIKQAMLRLSDGAKARENKQKHKGGNHHNQGKGHDQDHGHGHKHKGKGKGHKGHKGHKGKKDKCIVVDGKVGLDNGIENKLWYWREDLMLNQHHWYWHEVYPLNATRHPDRRAELFFFMHRSFLARYNAERLSNGLPRTFELDFQPGGIVHEGFNPHLADLASGKWWSARPPKQPLTDIIHLDDPNFARNIIIPEVLGIYGRLVKAARTGKMVAKNGKLIKIHHTQGIEPFSNTVEASELSVNPFFYDTFGLHNYGHMMIGFLTDPFFKLHIPPGPMAEQAMSMRDPSFYTYHTVIDNLFEKFKQALPPYKVIGGEFPLLWRGIEIHHIEMISKGHDHINQLRTFWTDRKFHLAPGVDRSVDIADDEQAKICAVHMAHEPFLFKFVIERRTCANSRSGKGTVRIFMAPRYDEKGRRLHLKEQRRLMFQLDAFQVKLRVGKNIITRRSHDSALTKPWSRSIHEVEEFGPDPSGAAEFCGCGWPQHLYIPRGSPKGMPFDLFVMVTNYDEDRVQDLPQDLKIPETCNSPYIFCGHPRRRYPDARPMGYPFDRPIHKPTIPCLPGHSFGSMVCQSFNLIFHKPVDTLEQFVSKAPNMGTIVFDIKHIDHFVGSHHH